MAIRPLTDLAKLNSIDGGVVFSGKRAFESGAPFDPSMGDLWCWGWQIGADQRRQKEGRTQCH